MCTLAAIAAVVVALFCLFHPTFESPGVTAIRQLTHDEKQTLFGVGELTPPLLTDGQRLYYSQFSPDLQGALMQISTDGGESTPVDIPFTYRYVSDISPNESQVLIKGTPNGPHGNGLWLLTLSGGQPRPIGNFTVTDATFSPDGTAIYYSSGPAIYKMSADGGQPQKILTTTGVTYWLRFSPDGSVFRFSVRDRTVFTNSMWEARPDGSHLRQVLTAWKGAGDECCGSWTADGRYFLFDSTQEGVPKLWAVRERAALWGKIREQPVRLWMGEMNEQSPLPSKDGKKVFFIGSTRRAELIRYDRRTRMFEPYLSGISAEEASFSGDGKRVAYVSYADSNLWVSSADGSDRQKLTFSPLQVGLPRWSPDGNQIAFSAREPGMTWQIYVIAADGGAMQQLTFDKVDHVDPTWSRDGNSILFGGLAAVAREAIDP